MAEEIDPNKLAEAIVKAQKANPPKTSGLSPAEALKATKEQIQATQNQTKAAQSSAASMSVVEKTGYAAAAGLLATSTVAKDTTESWRKVSQTGASFSNDVVKMQIAAAQSQLELNEFSEIITANGKNLAGLGGSVTRGTENFSKLSAELFKNKSAVDELTNLGLTTAQMNELLAAQMSTTRVLNLQNQEAVTKQIESAVKFNRELDLASKLSGQSRKELMDRMNDETLNARTEARFRLIEQQEGKAAADAARQNFKQLYAQAESNMAGSGKYFQEVFSTQGAILSDAVATQTVAYGEYGDSLNQAAMALSKGNVDAAETMMKGGQLAAAKMQGDSTVLSLATLGDAGGSVSGALTGVVKDTMPLADSLRSVAESSNILLRTQQDYAKTLEIINNDLTKSRVGITTNDQQVSGATRAILDAERKIREAKTAPIASADTIQINGVTAADLARSEGAKAATAISEIPNLHETFSTVAQDLADSISTGIKGISSFSVSDIKQLIIGGEALPGRATGSVGSTGKIIENFGSGTLAMLHGNEGVVTESQLGNLAKGLHTSGIESAIKTMNSTLSSTGTGSFPMFEMPDLSNVDVSLSSNYMNTVNQSIDKIGDSVKNMSDASLKSIKPFESEFSSIYDNLLGSINDENTGQFQELASVFEQLSQNAFQAFNTNFSDIGFKTPSINPINITAAIPEQSDNDYNTKTDKIDSPSLTTNKSTTEVHATHMKDEMFKEMVTQLKSLNKQMSKLLTQHEDLGKKQVKATKSNSQNIFEH